MNDTEAMAVLRRDRFNLSVEYDAAFAHIAARLAADQQKGGGEPDGYTSYGEFRWACDCNEQMKREWTPVYLAPQPSIPEQEELE